MPPVSISQADKQSAVYSNKELIRKRIDWKHCINTLDNGKWTHQDINSQDKTQKLQISHIQIFVHDNPENIKVDYDNNILSMRLVPYVITDNNDILALLPEVARKLEKLKTSKMLSAEGRNCKRIGRKSFECSQLFKKYYPACSEDLNNLAYDHFDHYPELLWTADKKDLNKLEGKLKDLKVKVEILTSSNELKKRNHFLLLKKGAQNRLTSMFNMLKTAYGQDRKIPLIEMSDFDIKAELLSDGKPMMSWKVPSSKSPSKSPPISTNPSGPAIGKIETFNIPEKIIKRANKENIMSLLKSKIDFGDSCVRSSIQIDVETSKVKANCSEAPEYMYIDGFEPFSSNSLNNQSDMLVKVDIRQMKWLEGSQQDSVKSPSFRFPLSNLGLKLCFDSELVVRCTQEPISLRQVLHQAPIHMESVTPTSAHSAAGDAANKTVKIRFKKGLQIQSEGCELNAEKTILNCQLKDIIDLDIVSPNVGDGDHKIILIALSSGLSKWVTVIRGVLYDELLKVRGNYNISFSLQALQPGGGIRTLLNSKELPSLVESGSKDSIQGRLDSMAFSSESAHALRDLEPLDLVILDRNERENRVKSIIYLTDNAKISEAPERIPSKLIGIPLVWNRLGIKLMVLTSAPDGCEVWKRAEAECRQWDGDAAMFKTSLDKFLDLDQGI